MGLGNLSDPLAIGRFKPRCHAGLARAWTDWFGQRILSHEISGHKESKPMKRGAARIRPVEKQSNRHMDLAR
jgi:hypothetical protein